MVNLQNIKVKSGSNFTTVCPFPVGYIYMSSTNTSPASVFGGTWSAITDGRIWRPWNSWNKTAGSDSHKLTIDEMPVHHHNIDDMITSSNGSNLWGLKWDLYGSPSGHIGTSETGGVQHTVSRILTGHVTAGTAQPNLKVGGR